MILSLVFFGIALALGVIFVFLLLTSGEYDEYIQPLNQNDFLFCEVYGVGFKILKLINFEYKSKTARKQREQMVILYGERYAEYYLQVYYAKRITLAYLVFCIVAPLCALADGTDKILMFGLAAIVCGVVYYFYSEQPGRMIKNRSEIFLSEFPNAVSTIALLVNSGMILRDAWKEVAFSSNTLLCMEMRKVNEDIDNGISEIDAMYSFANRCVTPEIKKFTSFVVQGLEKGNKDLAITLKNQTDELWELKKQNTLKKGELASSKLLIPLMIMFLGVLVMIMGPIMTNLNV